MTVTHTLAILFAVASLLTAIAAAVYWWKASRVTIQPPVASISDVPVLEYIRDQLGDYFRRRQAEKSGELIQDLKDAGV